MSYELPGPLANAPAPISEEGVEWLRSPVGIELAAYVRDTDTTTLGDQTAVTEVAAPPFGESARADWFLRRLEEIGMERAAAERPALDSEGNVVVRWPGTEPGLAPLVVSAHLDTVFPAGTDVKVHTSGATLRAPGIGDDGRGLATLLTLARTLVEHDVHLRRDLLMVATVGEEGIGDLRGVRWLFGKEGVGRDAAGFISIDGAGAGRVVAHGLGSVRFRIRVNGPGGHSWVDWGNGNPIHAVAAIVAAAAELPLPEDVTLSTGRISGGTSVNAIPEEAWTELEIRGRSRETIEQVRAALGKIVRERFERVDARRSRGGAMSLSVEVIGDRPPGSTDPGHPLVRAALDATVAIDERPELAISSTDANYPMSIGIPAITIGGGGTAGAAHTLDEWYTNTKGPDGIVRALVTLVLADRNLD